MAFYVLAKNCSRAQRRRHSIPAEFKFAVELADGGETATASASRSRGRTRTLRVLSWRIANATGPG